MDKKRVLIMADREAWEGTQRILKELHISNQVYNELLNGFIRSQYKLLQGLKDKRDSGEQITLGVFLKMMGGILDDLEDDQLKL